MPKVIADLNEISDGSGSEPGRTPGGPRRTASSLPAELFLVGTDRACFSATSNRCGRELWSYQPSANPLPVATDFILPTATAVENLSSDPAMLTPVGNLLFLVAKTAAGRDHFYIITSAGKIDVTLDGLDTGARVQDIAPMGTGAVVATFAGMKTTFWNVAANGAVKKLYDSNDHRLIGDMIDCDYMGKGFLAYTSRDPATPDKRILAVLDPKGPAASTVLSDDVEELAAAGTSLFITWITGNGTELHAKQADGALEFVTSEAGIHHLMAVDDGGTQTLYFLAGTPGSTNYMWSYTHDAGTKQLSWPTGESVRNVTSAVLIQGVPHVLGLGRAGTRYFWAVWKSNQAGASMTKLAELDDHWTDCSNLVGNAGGKLAFFGRYYISNAEVRVPHVGFLVGTTVTQQMINDLRPGTRPSALLALPDRVVFIADHRQLGIEPWSCSFP